MSPVATHGVVSLAALDVRVRPDHRAELSSQLLLGEVVRLLGRASRTDWWRVENLADGYRGWVRGWGLVRVTARRAGSWRERARARIRVPVAEVRTGPGRGGSVGPLFLGSRAIAGAARAGHRRLELPDGRRGWVPAGALSRRGERMDLLDRVKSLLGVPYHWGGRTAMGLDCSAFAQLILAERGVALPRDVRRQFETSRPLGAAETPAAGDLVFFGEPGSEPTHVAVGLGGDWFAHCRGMVRIGSSDPDNPLCDKALLRESLGWRRPAPTG